MIVAHSFEKRNGLLAKDWRNDAGVVNLSCAGRGASRVNALNPPLHRKKRFIEVGWDLRVGPGNDEGRVLGHPYDARCCGAALTAGRCHL
jgi:hypothetical protein